MPIKIEYINTNRKISYDYCHKGLVQLLDGTLDHFYESDVITCKNNESFKIVFLQPSLSQLVHGITSSHILLRQKETINLNDCIFIEEELRECVDHSSNKKGSDKKISSPKKRKHLLTEVIIKAYQGEMKRLNKEPSAVDIWNILRAEPHVAPCHPTQGNVERNEYVFYDADEIIQEMDDREMGWRNRDGKDKKLLFTSFETKLSKIRAALYLSSANL